MFVVLLTSLSTRRSVTMTHVRAQPETNTIAFEVTLTSTLLLHLQLHAPHT